MSSKPFKLAVLLFVSLSCFGQQNTKEVALIEIKDLVTNPSGILGKTLDEIMSMTRPDSIRGLNKWEVADTLEDSGIDKNYEVEKYVILDTGCGALNVWVSALSHKAFAMTYIPKTSIDLTQTEVKKYLRLPNRGDSWVIELKSNNSLIGISIMGIKYKEFKKYGAFQIHIITFENHELKHYKS